MIPLEGRNQRIILKRDDPITETQGGIQLHQKKGARTGTVLYTHDKRSEVKAGDKVYFTEFAGNAIKWDGEDVYIVTEKLILGKVEG